MDYGRKRIGIAIAEPPTYVAVPLGVLSVKGWDAILAHLKQLVEERLIKSVVVGIPVETSGRMGKMADEVRNFGTRLRKELRLPVKFVDERFTSNEAEKTLIAQGKSGGRRNIHRDAISASLILDTYLQRRKAKRKEA